MSDLIDFLPLRTETLQSIRARMDADVNAGIPPTDQAFMDTVEGSAFFDLSQVVALEAERLWDMAATEIPAAAFPKFAWGDYLDDHGETIGLERKAAAAATGQVTFSGTNGTLIATGTIVRTAQTDPDSDPIEFATTASATIASGTATVGVQAVVPGAQGNLAANQISEMPAPPSGVTSVTNAAAITGGADVESDEAYRERILLVLSSPQGAGTITDYKQWALAYAGVGFVSVEPLWDGAGTVRVMVTDVNNDPVGGTIVSGLKNLLDPANVATTTTGTNTLPTGTLNVVSTAGFRTSGKIDFGGQSVTYTGKTGTTFTGCTGGSGAISAGSAVTQSGEGRGLAPIGAIVTVGTPTTLTVNVAATITYASGYSATGTAGTIALTATITDAIKAYVDALAPGEDVILSKVIAAIADVTGVADVSPTSVQLAGVNATKVVAATEVAATGTVTLS